MSADPNHYPPPDKDATTETFSFGFRLPKGFKLSLVLDKASTSEAAMGAETVLLDPVPIIRRPYYLSTLSAKERDRWPVCDSANLDFLTPWGQVKPAGSDAEISPLD